VICFPFARHYIADSPGCFTRVTDTDDLIAKYNEIANYEKFTTFSYKTILKQIAIVIAVTGLLILSLYLIL